MPDLPDTQPNPDLTVGEDQRPRWNSAPHRRDGFHNLHRLTRYAQSFRAGQVMQLRLAADLTIANRADVAALTSAPWFSAMIVTRGNRVLYERYAPDFGPDQPHSIMSISKMTTNLLIGLLRDKVRLSLSETVGTYLPWIGAGYRDARLQDVLNMNVLNAYEENYSDPNTSAFLHEVACGMRLPRPGNPEPSNKEFLAEIGLAQGRDDSSNPTGACRYCSANTDVLAAVIEAVGGRPLGLWLADIADAAGMEALHVATDRTGFPMLNGGLCLTARDLSRFGMLIARSGRGVDGAELGSPAFLRQTLTGGIPMLPPRGHLRYSNQTNTNGRWLGHAGYGGQYMMIDMLSGTVGVFFSVLQNEEGYDAAYFLPIIQMLEAVTCT